MNATIQEIEGIDDYWGPAFRSVYEGEGHEAFVQQLDERIVQHDKEIEKLCNFHYQPKKKTKRRRRPLEPMESANYYTEYHHGKKNTGRDNYKASSGSKSRGCNTPPDRHFFSDALIACYDDNERPRPKRRRLDLRRLGGYSDTFPNAGSKKNYDFEPHNTRSLDSFNDLEQDDDQENEDDDLAELSCREYDEITEYHTMAMQQKNQEPRGECHVNSSDLRLYLRNRKGRDASVERCDQKQFEEERRRGHIRGTSAELPRDWREPSNRSSSYHNGDSQTSSKKHRSRREAFDDQNRDNRYELNSRRGQGRYDSIELRHSKSRHENRQHDECREVHGQNSSREFSLSKSRSNSGTSHSVYVEYQPNKSDRLTPLEKESDLNTSSDLRCYLRSKSKDDNVATVPSSDAYHPELITHFRRLSRASSNGSNSRVEREANQGNTVYDSNPKEHYRSGHAYENANSSFESHHAERFVGYSSAEHHQSSREPTKRHYEMRRHLSPRRDASSKAQNGYPLSLDHHCDPNRFITTEQRYQSRPLPAGLYHEKTRSLSAELHHRQSRELSTEHRQSQVVLAGLHQSQTRAVPTELSREDHPVPAELLHPRGASSAENHYSQSHGLSNKHYSDKNRYLSGDRHYNSSITFERLRVDGSSRETPERYRNTRHMSMERDYNESRYTSSERYSRENHIEQDCGEIRQTLSDRHCDSRQSSAEHHRDVRVNTSVDGQRNGDSRHNSLEPYREKRRHASSERQNRIDDSNAVATTKGNTNRLISNLDLAENSMPRKDLPKKSLPVYSRRHPGQSDNASESLLKNDAQHEALRNSLKTAVSGQETVKSDLNVTARSQFSKEYQSLPSDIPVCEPRLKEIQPDPAELREKESQREAIIRQYISVRAVEAINNSVLIAEPIGESSCVAACTVSFPKSANESNCNNPNGVMSRDPRLRPRHPDLPIELDINSLSTAESGPVIIESEKNTNLLNSRINRDPRLRPRQEITSLNTIHKETSNQTVQEATTDILTEVTGLPDFNPSNKTQDINKWIGRINEIAVTCNWTDQQVVDFAMSKLAGNAKCWYQGFTSSSDLSWSEWQEKLKAAFPFSENYGKMLSDMLNRTAKTGDSLEEYYLEKMTMLNRCDIRGKRAIECIIFGIEDEIVRTKAEAGNFSDPDELLGCLRSLKNRRADSELLYNDLPDNP